MGVEANIFHSHLFSPTLLAVVETLMAPRRMYPKAECEVGVYGIYNEITGKWYVGSSLEITKRWWRHLWELRQGKHHSPKLQRSFNKHGEGAFRFLVLEECASEELESRETATIERLKAHSGGYNVASEAKGGFMRGRQWPEETKAARVEAMKGFRHSEESKERIRKAKKEQWANPEQRAKIAASQRCPKSAEGAARIAAASLKRLQDQSPEQVEARRQNLIKGWATRRAKKALAESQSHVVSVEENDLG